MEKCINCKWLNKQLDVAAYSVCMNPDSDCFAMVVKENNICSLYERLELPVDDLSFGMDRMGEYALFIDAKHIDGWKLDKHVIKVTRGRAVFFRVITEGEQSQSHGWIEKNRVSQWG